jgi:hypothetical protein
MERVQSYNERRHRQLRVVQHQKEHHQHPNNKCPAGDIIIFIFHPTENIYLACQGKQKLTFMWNNI